MTSWLVGAAYTGGILCMGALFLLYMYQDHLLYFPTIPGTSKLTKENPPGYRHPGEFSIDYEDLIIPCKDGVKIHAWLMKQRDHTTCPTLIFFHGNAGNIGYRLPNAVQLYRKVGVNILLVDYRGFGHSEGNPSEKGLKLDAEAALDAMYARTDIDTSKLLVFGRSLGGAVSVYLAKKEPSRVAAVVLENTFLSISAMVDALMPFLTYFKPLVLRIHWNNEMDIQKRLRSLAISSQRVVWYPISNGTHNNSWLRGGSTYFSELRQFVNALGSDTTCMARDDSAEEDRVTFLANENSIPNMLEQPLLGSLQKTPEPPKVK